VPREPEDLEKLRGQSGEPGGEIAAEHKLDCDHEWTEVFHPTINSDDAVDLAKKAAGKVPAVSEIMEMEHPFSWSEDFGRFTGRYPGALIGLGAGEDHPHLHDTRYDFPDELIDTGIRLFAGIIDEYGLF
jgi:metal-dependent amidase/aminoacylase/carboxypeptidase family protein